ncbi:YHS domain-containing (seleno)protein [Reinekea sp. G2M2-21]|uniref:YHS domain-containing (seleno)protein n=1 Tax=Reinekea sp. G2M2-21 TaxID=2788942 RepID=UPI0018AC5E75|nr:YHS domain-containing (seleno)protein [Reinekea sp. G2M2-21]
MLKPLSKFLLIFGLIGSALAVDAIFTPWHNNLAIKGFDPVAYFTDNSAIEGNADFEYEWQGAIWRFASAQHRDMFISDPNRYAPQYGGYCAYAVANNNTAGIDPDQFTIVDGKLYLNYNAKIQEKWLRERDSFINAADQYWPDLLAK